MDPIREFIEGLDSVDMIGAGASCGRLIAGAARIISGVSFSIGGATAIFLASGTLFGLIVSVSFIRAVFG